MQPLNFSQHARTLNAAMLGVAPVRAYVTVRHRNAWHNTQSNQYRDTWALSSDSLSARIEAESWRKSGSRFSIIETPALALLTAEGALVCADFHRADPFGGIDLDMAVSLLRAGEPLATGAHALGPSGPWRTPVNENSLLQGVEAYMPVSLIGADEAFKAYDSVAPAGRGLEMGWTSRARQEVRADFVWSIVNASLQDAGLDLDEVIGKYEALQEELIHPTGNRLSSPEQE